MRSKSIFSVILKKIIHKYFALSKTEKTVPPYPKNVLIVRQHNQFGDMLATVPLFRALKEKNPRCRITLIASPSNNYAVKKNRFIDDKFDFNKKKLFNPFYLLNFIKILRRKYDIAIVPATVSISFTSNFIARISNSDFKIGPNSLDGVTNDYSFLFNKPIDLDWRKYPDSHVSDFIQDIVRPFGFASKNFRTEINFDGYDKREADEFISEIHKGKKEMLIGLHIGAGKPQNRWALQKFAKLITRLKDNYDVKFYITGSKSDKEEINYMKSNLDLEITYCLNKEIPVLAAIIEKSDLFITNDTGVMHVAGATGTPQISIFGHTNPYNWAPVGQTKYFIRKSDLIDDVSVDDVYNLCSFLLNKKKKKND